MPGPCHQANACTSMLVPAGPCNLSGVPGLRGGHALGKKQGACLTVGSSGGGGCCEHVWARGSRAPLLTCERRDGDDMKAAARMRHFPPTEPRCTVLVTTNRWVRGYALGP